MNIYVAVVACLLTAPTSCLELYADQTVGSNATCAIVGQALAAQWLPEHPNYRLERVRCRLGTPFPHLHDA